MLAPVAQILATQPTHLKRYWPLNDPNGNPADLSGQNKPLTASFVATFISYLVDSIGGPSIQLGGDAILTRNDGVTLGADWTILFCGKHAYTWDWQVPFWMSGNSTGIWFNCAQDASSTLYLEAYDDAGNGIEIPIPNALGSIWHDFAAVSRGGKVYVYMDGVCVNPGGAAPSAPFTTFTNSYTGVGCQWDANADQGYWADGLAHIAIWDCGLSDAEVLAIHNQMRYFRVKADGTADFTTVQAAIDAFNAATGSFQVECWRGNLGAVNIPSNGTMTASAVIFASAGQSHTGKRTDDAPLLGVDGDGNSIILAKGSLTFRGLKINGMVGVTNASAVFDACLFDWGTSADTIGSITLSGSTTAAKSWTVRNCVFYNCYIAVWCATQTQTITFNFQNNSGYVGQDAYPDPGTSIDGLNINTNMPAGKTLTLNTHIQNNAILGGATGLRVQTGGTGTSNINLTDCDYNAGTGSGWGAPTTPSTHYWDNQDAANWFVDPLNDLTLKPGSPGIDAGLDKSATYTTDAAGRTRVAPWDVGALEVPPAPPSPPSVTLNPVNTTVTAGQTATFTSTATGSPSPTLQWEANSGGGWGVIGGATSSPLSFTAQSTDNGKQYHAVFTNTGGSATSAAATLTVQWAPTITLAPQNQTVTTGQGMSFSATASANPAATLQWQLSTNGGNSFTDIPGATTSPLTSPTTDPSMNGYQYRAVFTNALGSVNSTAATLSVQVAPVITQHPSDLALLAGFYTSFTSAASGNPVPTVKWQVSSNGGLSYGDIPGETTTSLIFVTDLSQTGYKYRAVFTNALGSATTNAATLTVTEPPPGAPIIVAEGGGSSLLKATVIPFPRENLACRASAIQCADPGTGKALIWTGPRLRTKHLIALDSTANRRYRAAVKDSNDMWSEWSASQDAATPAFVPVATNEVSIGSGAGDDLSLEEPAVRFPQLHFESAREGIYRTVVSESFWDEQRKSRWTVKRAAFTCVLRDLDEEEALLLHRFYRALNGPLTPFWFDWIDPDSGEETRYIVRFRDPTLADELFTVDRSNMEFTLVELVGKTDAAAA